MAFSFTKTTLFWWHTETVNNTLNYLTQIQGFKERRNEILEYKSLWSSENLLRPQKKKRKPVYRIYKHVSRIVFHL